MPDEIPTVIWWSGMAWRVYSQERHDGYWLYTVNDLKGGTFRLWVETTEDKVEYPDARQKILNPKTK
jgi:hypothetical protein